MTFVDAALMRHDPNKDSSPSFSRIWFLAVALAISIFMWIAGFMSGKGEIDSFLTQPISQESLSRATLLQQASMTSWMMASTIIAGLSLVLAGFGAYYVVRALRASIAQNETSIMANTLHMKAEGARLVLRTIEPTGPSGSLGINISVQNIGRTTAHIRSVTASATDAKQWPTFDDGPKSLDLIVAPSEEVQCYCSIRNLKDFGHYDDFAGFIDYLDVFGLDHRSYFYYFFTGQNGGYEPMLPEDHFPRDY